MSIADYRIFAVILESMLFAFYIVVLMAFYCAKSWKDSKRVPGIFAISVGLFLMCAAAWTLDICVLSLQLYQLLPSRFSPNGPDTTIDQATTTLYGNLKFARSACTTVIYIFCDIISLWRAYVIYGRPRWLKITSLSLFSFSCILYIATLVLDDTSGLGSPPTFAVRLEELDGGAVPEVLSSMAVSTTAFSQVFVTALIARKAWIYRKDLQSLLPAQRMGSSNRKRLTSVFYVVIETGIVYSLLWVIFVLAHEYALGLTGAYWSEAWVCQISGIYPTLIVVIISERASILEQGANNASGLGSVSIRFAANDDLEALHPVVPDKTLPGLASEGTLDQSL
ncbi:hypothetical protein PENSPDRAFT_649251 [Peniophora sp. CONT]|nr:hypothetical protein PENSPDRAFT_649251 [Peniophora sp. CONT]